MSLEIQNAVVINYDSEHFGDGEYVMVTTEDETNYFFKPRATSGGLGLVLEWGGMDEAWTTRVRESSVRKIDPVNQLSEEERVSFELKLRSDGRLLPMYYVCVIAIGSPLIVTYVEEEYSTNIMLPGGAVSHVAVPWSANVRT